MLLKLKIVTIMSFYIIDIDVKEAEEFSYEDFVLNYLAKNKPVVIRVSRYK